MQTHACMHAPHYVGYGLKLYVMADKQNNQKKIGE